MPSATGVFEIEQKIVRLRKCRDYICALTLSRKVLNIRVHHLTTAYFSCNLDVADAHETVASVLDDIILQLSHPSAKELKAKHKDESASHYFSAFEIKREELGSHNPFTLKALKVYQDRIAE